MTDAALPGSLSSFILDLSSMTVPKTNNNTHFPRDLSIINEILVSIFEVLEQRASGISSYTVSLTRFVMYNSTSFISECSIFFLFIQEYSGSV